MAVEISNCDGGFIYSASYDNYEKWLLCKKNIIDLAKVALKDIPDRKEALQVNKGALVAVVFKEILGHVKCIK